LTYRTTNGQYQGDCGGLLNSDNWLRLGRPPTLRNRPVPKNRTSHDKQDYGDEAGVRSVIQPNIYTEYGLTQRDLLMLRGKDEIKRIIDSCGLSGYFNNTISFDDVWSKAGEMDKQLLHDLAPKDADRVSLYAFKEVLFGKRADEIREQVDREFTSMCC
uniref:NAD(+) synthase n=1 Tax=Echinostoma caproni TaxID=27848 RepID=A0A183B581_9TREM